MILRDLVWASLFLGLCLITCNADGRLFILGERNSVRDEHADPAFRGGLFNITSLFDNSTWNHVNHARLCCIFRYLLLCPVVAVIHY